MQTVIWQDFMEFTTTTMAGNWSSINTIVIDISFAALMIKLRHCDKEWAKIC
jgi:hypothetical protein